MDMKAIIIGAGKVGFALAESVRRKGHDVIVVDKDERACEKMRDLDVMVIKGNGVKPDLLDSLELSSSDYFFAVTDDNETNLVSCSLAKSEGCTTIARINGSEYIARPISKRFLKIGIDFAVSPERIITEKIANIITVPSAINMNLWLGGKINVIEFKVLKNSEVEGKKIAELGIPSNVNLGAIIRGNTVIVPRGDSVLEVNDKVIAILSHKRSKKEMLRLMGKSKNTVERVLIVGASTVGLNVARILERLGIDVKVLEDSELRARHAAERLRYAEVIMGDVKDKRVLIKEEIQNMDALVAAYGSEGLNVLVSLLAKSFGVEKTIALVPELTLKSLIETVGVDMGASPQLETAKIMLRLARKLHPLNAIPIHGGDLYVLEMYVSESSKVRNKRIEKARLPEQAIVGAMIRDGKTIIPRGYVEFKEGDQVLFFVLKEEIENVEALFT